MKFSSTIACAFAALAVAGGTAGTAAADDEASKFGNSGQFLSCEVIEVIDQPNLAPSDNNIDCSKNLKEEDTNLMHVVKDVLSPRHESH
ncbi:hypothetical protein [Streptomyces leeuwenhoekii]|uniref:Secreted Protein n=1 Tax=Streptomyces leeuwenhoekii TaxID=1437453 RepID=A0A0F7VMW8_STRLW|nr:hypothetical protein [Streptomyces leeuwenhoekii]CQR59508.1 Hypothetical Protein sle_00460 [Streptomyces leeuwenhoekii]